MNGLNEELDLKHYWEELEQARQSLLLLDFDGTLAPFVVNPAEARPYSGVTELLEKIVAAGKTQLVIVCGREIANLRQCLADDRPPDELLWFLRRWSALRGG